jgi:hypothetical protein
MRTVYNLTDRVPPVMKALKKGRAPKPLLVDGQLIAPGGSVLISDTFRLGTVGSLIATEAIAVDHLPAWYQAAKDDTPKEAPKKVKPPALEPEAKNDEEPPAEEPEETPKKTGRRKKKS